MRILKILTMLLVFMSMGAYAQPDPVVYTQDKPTAMLSAESPEFVIKLKANPTTGFSWFLRDFNAELIEPVKYEYVASTDKKLVGAPGFELWTFRARPGAFIVPQQTTIRLVYARPWESAETPTQLIFKVTTQRAQAAAADSK